MYFTNTFFAPNSTLVQGHALYLHEQHSERPIRIQPTDLYPPSDCHSRTDFSGIQIPWGHKNRIQTTIILARGLDWINWIKFHSCSLAGSWPGMDTQGTSLCVVVALLFSESKTNYVSLSFLRTQSISIHPMMKNNPFQNPSYPLLNPQSNQNWRSINYSV